MTTKVLTAREVAQILRDAAGTCLCQASLAPVQTEVAWDANITQRSNVPVQLSMAT